jgi:hypothetical protein
MFVQGCVYVFKAYLSAFDVYVVKLHKLRAKQIDTFIFGRFIVDTARP